jgi:hypothetical protein
MSSAEGRCLVRRVVSQHEKHPRANGGDDGANDFGGDDMYSTMWVFLFGPTAQSLARFANPVS